MKPRELAGGMPTRLFAWACLADGTWPRIRRGGQATQPTLRFSSPSGEEVKERGAADGRGPGRGDARMVDPARAPGR